MTEESNPAGDEKKVDEEWKEQARTEKERIGKKKNTDQRDNASKVIPTASFQTLITTFATQALIGLGVAPSPVDNERTIDLDSAKFGIDMLQTIQDKTKGNLTDVEKKYITAVLYDLRLRFVNAASGKRG